MNTALSSNTRDGMLEEIYTLIARVSDLDVRANREKTSGEVDSLRRRLGEKYDELTRFDANAGSL
jgi:hypothetical protein